MSEFYQITPTIAQVLRKANLTASEWKIWSYLVEIDPWGNRYEKVDTLSAMTACGVSKATYYRAIAKFQEEKIFDFQDNGFNVRNLHGVRSLKNEKTVSEMRQTSKISDSQNCENSLKNEKTVSKMRQLSQNCENRGSKVACGKESESPQISSYYSDHLEDRSDEIIFSENANSENSQVAIAIENEKVDDADKCDLKADEGTEDRISPVKHINPVEGDSPRRALEDFILQTRQFAPRDRTAYFAKFTTKDWQEWEIKFKPPATESNPPAFKAFVPEAIEVIPPDVALANIRRIREMLKRGGK